MAAIRGRIRAGQFASIFDKTSATLRTERFRGEDPIESPHSGDVRDDEHDIKEGGQRTFGGDDVFAYELFTALREMGMPASGAADCVRFSLASETFLKRLERGQDVSDLYLVAEIDAEEDEQWGYRTIPGYHICSASSIAATLTKQAERYGTEYTPRFAGDDADTPARPKHIYRGNLWMRILPLMPHYHRARARARAAGFALDGFYVFPFDKDGDT